MFIIIIINKNNNNNNKKNNKQYWYNIYEFTYNISPVSLKIQKY